MNNLLNLTQIKLDQNLSSQQEVFELISQIAVDHGIANSKQEVIDGLKHREEESTTGFQDGFAIPHTQTSAITKPGIVVVSSNDGIEWESLDEKPARFFISLLIPEEEVGTTHIKALASLSRMLIHDDKREKLLNAESADTVYETINEALNQ
ncbi:PTS sugar transporter subunit IIA [Bacillus taeanensis]|uniref:PTS EIIA type-2 domain-containing protein n=1 Tax=Bacillus taeanensis TaxID=273032 RepID=A0A366XQN2_9BACI|nr:fructose PTS transporter subunit IIA [Bacillus taeanensis]RBW68660.1 hypothetical protein DS031_15995 [Bacillus taeanensis]